MPGGFSSVHLAFLDEYLPKISKNISHEVGYRHVVSDEDAVAFCDDLEVSVSFWRKRAAVR